MRGGTIQQEREVCAALQYAASFSLFGGGMERLKNSSRSQVNVDFRGQEKGGNEASDRVVCAVSAWRCKDNVNNENIWEDMTW